MRWLLLAACAWLAGCADSDGGSGGGASDGCPGHFHVALLVAYGDDAVRYLSAGDSVAQYPAPGVHMHADDGLLHIHPAVETCVTYAQALAAVGVTVAPGEVSVDGTAYAGEILLEVQPWNGSWQAMQLDATTGNGARVLVAVDAQDVAALRAQVPPIPPMYQPA